MVAERIGLGMMVFMLQSSSRSYQTFADDWVFHTLTISCKRTIVAALALHFWESRMSIWLVKQLGSVSVVKGWLEQTEACRTACRSAYLRGVPRASATISFTYGWNLKFPQGPAHKLWKALFLGSWGSWFGGASVTPALLKWNMNCGGDICRSANLICGDAMKLIHGGPDFTFV